MENDKIDSKSTVTNEAVLRAAEMLCAQIKELSERLSRIELYLQNIALNNVTKLTESWILEK